MGKGVYHFGRDWEAPDPYVATCGCGQALCGLVDSAQVSDSCGEHSLSAAKTIRSYHEARECWWHRDTSE